MFRYFRKNVKRLPQFQIICIFFDFWLNMHTQSNKRYFRHYKQADRDRTGNEL